jgi:hypothetical protein
MFDDPSDNIDQPALLPPWASLRYRDYSFFFLLSLLATTAQQMRQAQNFYQVYELSGSAVQLGLTGLAQGISIFALGLFGGTSRISSIGKNCSSSQSSEICSSPLR